MIAQREGRTIRRRLTGHHPFISRPDLVTAQLESILHTM
jgi:hypothetical protein